ncbi:MAG: single-stranded DNA-binding protein [Pseudomonadota bacterium]
MVYTLIAISLLILLAIGLAALFLAGKSHRSSSVEDLNKDDE